MSEVYLAHHGILGQKWGIRRYQNYDGSYTRAGVKRYNASKATYDQKRSELRSLKNSGASKSEINKAKGSVKIAKRKMDKDYRHLKLDKMADKGKERYQSGQTITNRTETLRNISSVAGAAAIGAKFAYRLGYLDYKTANIVSAGSAAVTGATYVASLVSEHGNKQLRAYYTHTSNY